MKERLKGLVSERMRLRIRRLGRLRWLTKASVVRSNGLRPRDHLGFVLLDPEIDSFTYELDNPEELAATLAAAAGLDEADVLRHVREALTDPLLERALRQPPARWLWMKRRPPLHGFLLTHWALIRLLRPKAVAEAGILDGMASTVMLAALERNAQDGTGDDGVLVSVDIIPGAGALVPDWLRPRWRPAYGDSVAELGTRLDGLEVGYLVSDSLPSEDHVRAEVEAVLRHRAGRFVVASVWGTPGAFPDAGEVVRFQDRPRGHFYGGRRFSVVRYPDV